jgi:hypothetical protein
MSTGRKAIPKCVIKSCDRPQESHGLCNPCCQAARRAIRKSNGRLTWAKLEAKGLALPLSNVRSDSNPVSLAIAEAGLSTSASTSSKR